MALGDVPAASTGRLSLKERQRQEREALILQAAEAVLMEKGYHAASMDEIAARVGVAKGTLYLHFPSKEELVVALFERELTAFRHAVEQAAMSEQSARARLVEILRLSYTGMAAERRQLFLALSSSASVRTEVFEKRDSLREHKRQVGAYIEAVLEDGKAAGEFDASIPTTVMLSTFVSLLSRHNHGLLDGDALSPDELVAYVERIYFHGISTHSVQEK
jgi:AcrR family transcriptional regulator